MLKVQEFLKSGKTLRQLSQKYNIQCNISTNDLVALNYTNLSPMDEEIVKECRGLFLEINTWDIVCKSFRAFGGLGEETTEQVLDRFDWNTAKLIEKLDGALICLYYRDDQWNVGMRMSADGSMQVVSVNGVPTVLSFAELTKKTIMEMGYTWEDYAERLNKDYYYSFELCTPETRVGVIYLTRKLVLLGAVDKYTLEEIDPYTLDFPLEKPDYTKVSSLDEVKKIIAPADPLKVEGYILVDDNFNRLKYKNENYLHMMAETEPESELEALEQLLQYVITFSSVASDSYISNFVAMESSPMNISLSATPGSTNGGSISEVNCWRTADSAVVSISHTANFSELVTGAIAAIVGNNTFKMTVTDTTGHTSNEYTSNTVTITAFNGSVYFQNFGGGTSDALSGVTIGSYMGSHVGGGGSGQYSWLSNPVPPGVYTLNATGPQGQNFQGSSTITINSSGVATPTSFTWNPAD